MSFMTPSGLTDDFTLSLLLLLNYEPPFSSKLIGSSPSSVFWSNWNYTDGKPLKQLGAFMNSLIF